MSDTPKVAVPRKIIYQMDLEIGRVEKRIEKANRRLAELKMARAKLVPLKIETS